MPFGIILLVAIGVLIYFGVLHRVLDRMKLNDKTALLFLAMMVVGFFLPAIPLSRSLSINIGGGIVPIVLAVYLIVTADEAAEKIRSIIASIISGIAVFFTGRLLPAEPEVMIIDPLFAFAIIAGVVAYIFGRSRRGAFIAGILGILIGDLLYAFGVAGRPIGTVIGGAGVFDATVISGVIAVLLCEIVGETRERLQGGTAKADLSARKENKVSNIEVKENNSLRGDEKDET
ncbi:MAG: DUF1614 domain-containing protein [Thermovenabulum sp.]|uniref:DUF1614 domain-containing protein n=1 Tax=Thermovenabulum sp. TaxID=3100335 RepID=UPI003C7D5153